jgi:Flp pilus assembly protein TadD
LARAARAARDFGSAVNLYRNAIAANPQDAAIRIELGDTLVDAGSYDDAIFTYGQVDAKSPERAHALLGLIRVELILYEPAKAVAYADAARAVAPHDIRVLVSRGVALDTVGRHADAQESYRAVIAADPNDLAARNDLALSLALSGTFDEAIEIMKPIALSSNATARSRQNLALIYGLKGDDAQASSMSQLDLDTKAAAANLHFFDVVRTNTN